MVLTGEILKCVRSARHTLLMVQPLFIGFRYAVSGVTLIKLSGLIHDLMMISIDNASHDVV